LKTRLILGSGSPRRLELLAVLGIVPDAVRPPDIDEDPARGNSRAPIARASPPRRSRRSGGADDIVLCADTTVALGRRIMGKPADAAEAEAFLTALSGRRHRVYTGVAVKRGDRVWERVVESRVRMKQLSKPRSTATSRPATGRARRADTRSRGRGGVHPVDLRQSFGHRGPAAGGNGEPADGGGLSGLEGAMKGRIVLLDEVAGSQGGGADGRWAA
jgi:septum formation protein